MTCQVPHVLRPGRVDDLPLVVHAWVQEMRHAPSSKGVSDAIYFPQQRALVLELLGRSNTIVACNPEDPGHVYGYMVWKDDVAHWCYVKSVYRRLGLANALMRGAWDYEPGAMLPIRCSQMSGTMLRLLRERPDKANVWEYDPSALEIR